MCSSSDAYAFHGPLSTRYWVSTVPEPDPSSGSSVTSTGPFWPCGRARLIAVVGAVPSTRTPSTLADSTLGSAAVSVAQ
jgi:hypothetical protein